MRPTPFYALIALTSWPVVHGLFRLRVEGLENVPAGGCVLAANHTSNLDPWTLGIPLWPRRMLRFMAKSELYWWPLSRLLDAAGAFPVRRGERDLEAIETAVALARAGNAIAMFPEGTRRRKGIVKRYVARPHTGAARIAHEAGVPLVPVAIKGTDRLARLGPIRIRYGRPFAAGHDPRETTEELMAAIARLYATL